MENIKCEHEFIKVSSELVGTVCCFDSTNPCNGCANCGYWSGDTGYENVTYRCKKCGMEKIVTRY